MKKGLERLPKNWAALIAAEYEQGASDVEVRAKLRMTQKLWDNIYNDPESGEFREVVDFGRMLAKAWWLSTARLGLRDRQLNANLWYMIMKNQYGWSEKSTTTTKDAESMSADELDEKIRRAFEKYRKVTKA